MTCDQVQQLLGRFHDGELEPSKRTSVEAHLRTCGRCSAELTAIGDLGEVIRSASELDPPSGLWDQITSRLGNGRGAHIARSGNVLRTRKAAMLVAVALIGVGLGWIAHQINQPHWVAKVAAPVADEKEGLSLDDLLAAGPKEQVTLQEAAHRVDFLVLGASDLPDGYRLGDCCLCQDGCCDLVQCRFVRGADQVILVQCGPDHMVQYGDRPVLETKVNGKPARVCQCDGRLVCSWQCKGTALTLVGPRDLTQLVGLVAYLDQRLENRP
jgi:hypothetical protein